MQMVANMKTWRFWSQDG